MNRRGTPGKMYTLRFTTTTGTHKSSCGKRTSAFDGNNAIRFLASVASSVAVLSNLRILNCPIRFSVSSWYARL